MYYDNGGRDIYSMMSQGKQYPTRLDTPSGGAGGGTNGGIPEVNWEDFAATSESGSSSYAGPSDWAKEWTQNYLNRFQPGLNDVSTQWSQSVNDQSPIGTLNSKQISDLLANLMNTKTGTKQNTDTMRNNLNTNTQDMRGLIEQTRKLMPQQYAEEMKLYNDRATQPVLNRMSNRGILNSSVTGGALSDVLRDTQAKQSDMVTQANVWAGNQNLDLSKYITDKGFDIDRYLADQSYATNQYQTDKMYGANETTANRQLEQEKEKRTGLKTTELTYANLIPSLLNALKESQSTSQGSSFGGLMELLLASQGG
jgi:hypothetical protein